MANTCRECGGDIFLGELRCPRCRAEIPNAREGAVIEGVPTAEGTSGRRPPPEGLGLIIEAFNNDREIDRRNERDAMGSPGRGSGSGFTIGGDDGTFSSALGPAYGNRSFDDAYDDLADMVRPERDAQGRITYDVRYALVGAVVVAVVAAYAFWRVFMIVDTVSRVSRIS